MPFSIDTVANPRTIVSGNYSYAAATAANTDAFIDHLRDKMLAAGWTLGATTTSSGHPDHKMDSAQAPWYDDITGGPASYIGKVRVRIHATANDRIRLQVSNISETFIQNTAREFIFTAGATNNWRYIIYPYQFVMFHPTGNFHSCIISAIHTPRWIQELDLEECLVSIGSAAGSSYHTAMYGAGDVFYKFKTSTIDLAVDINATADGPRLSVPIQWSASTGNIRVPNLVADPTLVDSTKWFPFLVPAIVGLPDNILLNVENNWRWRGWYWGGIVLNVTPSVRPFQIQFNNGAIYDCITINNSGASGQTGALFFRSS